jgi:hypothetical protein
MAPRAGSPRSTPGTVAGFAQSAPNAELMGFAQLELRRVGFAPHPAVPFREHNLPTERILSIEKTPVIYQCAFRRGTLVPAASLG